MPSPWDLSHEIFSDTNASACYQYFSICYHHAQIWTSLCMVHVSSFTALCFVTLLVLCSCNCFQLFMSFCVHLYSKSLKDSFNTLQHWTFGFVDSLFPLQTTHFYLKSLAVILSPFFMFSVLLFSFVFIFCCLSFPAHSCLSFLSSLFTRSPRKVVTYTRPTIASVYRSRSLSPSVRRRLEALDLEEPLDGCESEDRPPFVVRKVSLCQHWKLGIYKKKLLSTCLPIWVLHKVQDALKLQWSLWFKPQLFKNTLHFKTGYQWDHSYMFALNTHLFMTFSDLMTFYDPLLTPYFPGWSCLNM